MRGLDFIFKVLFRSKIHRMVILGPRTSHLCIPPSPGPSTTAHRPSTPINHWVLAILSPEYLSDLLTADSLGGFSSRQTKPSSTWSPCLHSWALWCILCFTDTTIFLSTDWIMWLSLRDSPQTSALPFAWDMRLVIFSPSPPPHHSLLHFTLCSGSTKGLAVSLAVHELSHLWASTWISFPFCLADCYSPLGHKFFQAGHSSQMSNHTVIALDSIPPLLAYSLHLLKAESR